MGPPPTYVCIYPWSENFVLRMHNIVIVSFQMTNVYKSYQICGEWGWDPEAQCLRVLDPGEGTTRGQKE